MKLRLRNITLLLCTVAVSGCNTPGLSPVDYLLLQAQGRIHPIPMLDAEDLAAELETGVWSRDRAWSAVDEVDTAVRREQIDRSRPVLTMRNLPKFRWNFSIDLDDTDYNTDREFMLLRVMERPGLVGDTACLLIARSTFEREPPPYFTLPEERPQTRSGHAISVVTTVKRPPPRVRREVPTAVWPRLLEVIERDVTPPVTAAGASPNVADQQAARQYSQQLAIRCAAVEAWALYVGQHARDPLTDLEPLGRLAEAKQLDRGLRAELLRSLGRWVPPTTIPTLNETLEAYKSGRRSTEIEQAALDACLAFAVTLRESGESADNSHLWPPAMQRWTQSIRSATQLENQLLIRFSRWLAVTKSPQAESLLIALQSHKDSQVQNEVRVSLGILGSTQSLGELLNAAAEGEPLARAAAVKGLSFHAIDDLRIYADDQEPALRQAVAEMLPFTGDQDAYDIVRELLLDRNPQVAAAMMNTLKTWPDDWAIPLCVQAVGGPTRRARQMALQEIADRTGLLPPENTEADAATNSLALMQWARTMGLPVAPPESVKAAEHAGQEPAVLNPELVQHLALAAGVLPAPLSEQRVVVTQLAARRDIDERHLNAVFERYRVPEPQRLDIERNVWPDFHAAFAHLAELESPELQQRRRAAARLAQLTHRDRFSDRVAERIAAVLAKEDDGAVWESLWQAVSEQDHNFVSRLATAASRHRIPRVRSLAADYARKHPRREFAPWLWPLILDDRREVRLVAIEAAGKCGETALIDGYLTTDGSTPEGLRSLLGLHDMTQHLKVTQALLRLQDPFGREELARLLWHPAINLRLAVVEVIAETKDPYFVSLMIDWANEQTVPAAKKAADLALLQLVREADHPAGLQAERRTDDRLKIWNRWWQSQGISGKI